MADCGGAAQVSHKQAVERSTDKKQAWALSHLKAYMESIGIKDDNYLKNLT
jgi:hypothetical protein